MESNATARLLWKNDVDAGLSEIIDGLASIDSAGFDAANITQLARIQTAASQLSGLVNGAFWAPQQDEEVTQLSALTSYLESRWGPILAAKGMDLTTKMRGDLPADLALAPVPLGRILSALIANAIKHAGKDSIHLSVDMRGARELRITVRDHGPGFSNADLEKVYAARTASMPKAQPAAEITSGLLVAYQQAQHLGGRLTISNAKDGGAEVSVLLPRETWELPQAEETDLPDLAGRHLLVAEDNPTNQMVISQMLDHLGVTYRVVGNGIEALDALKTETFAGALIDIEMPGMNGIELIRQVRALPAPGNALPILAITAYVLQTHRDEIRAAGADGIIAKPIAKLDAFSATVAKLVGSAPPPVAPAADVTLLHDQLYDAAQLERLLEISGAAQAPALLRQLQEDLSAAAAGLEQAVRTADIELIRTQTHALISLCGTIGATGAQQLARALNTDAFQRPGDAFSDKAQRLLGHVHQLITALRAETLDRFGEQSA